MPIKSDDGIFLARECPGCQGTGKQMGASPYNHVHHGIEVVGPPMVSVCKQCEGKGYYQVCTTVDTFVRYIADQIE